jgi:hypothetical protein
VRSLARDVLNGVVRVAMRRQDADGLTAVRRGDNPNLFFGVLAACRGGGLVNA